ncbi:MAG: histidine kinase dimerization/phosphoacceptor domain -containing protein, partial [Betaproteobacteria bacterium]|nr:histidine kinase dimerization/phosphoacceptor domain -containing protein [Betaproteobacteria bacterium]
AESYVGVTLWNHAAQPIGLIAVIGRRPLENTSLAEATLKLVAARAAAELERMDADTALRESEEQFHQISGSAQDAIIMMDAAKRISFWNAAAERIFGYPAAEVMGQELHPLITPVSAHAAFLRAFPHFAASGEGALIGKVTEVSALRKGGEEFPVELSLSATRLNRQWHAIGIVRDITARKQAEQKLRDSLAEKEVLMREIQHRVKNNLQMMSALLELQSDYVKDEKVLGYFKDSQQRIQSMALIHEQLYRSDNLAQIDFADFLRGLMDNLCGQFRERCSQVNVRINAQACRLPVDVAIPCGLVVTELVSNAFKHAYPEGRAGELRITLQCSDDGKVALEVADDGVGLPPGLDLRRGKSFGLRVITLMVEEQLHGKLRVESDHGTRVVCEIGVPQ